MNLERFEQFLQCPKCHSKLVRKTSDQFICQTSDHVYPVIDGVPVLLSDVEFNQVYQDLNHADQMRSEFNPGVMQKCIRLVKKCLGSTLHQPISRRVSEIWLSYDQNPRLVVGSGTTASASNQVNLDIDQFKNVDVVASALCIPFKDNTFKLVWNTAVLEHVRDPKRVVDEMYRVMKPGGYIYTELPFIAHFHAYPNDFQRYTIEGLTVLFKDYDVVEAGVCVGPGSAFTAIAADWFELFSFSNNRIVNGLFRLVPLVLLWPLKYTDYLLVKNDRAHEVSMGLYILCRKPVDTTLLPIP